MLRTWLHVSAHAVDKLTMARAQSLPTAKSLSYVIVSREICLLRRLRVATPSQHGQSIGTCAHRLVAYLVLSAKGLPLRSVHGTHEALFLAEASLPVRWS
jgi:hypothetical protein